MIMKKPFALIGLLMGVVVTSLCSCESKSSLERAAGRRPGPRTVPTQLPADVKTKFNVQLLGGEQLGFGALLGGNKVVVVNFWATWCGPCRREIPELTALDREFRGKGVEIVGLSVEEPAAATDLVRSFGQQYSIEYRLGFASSEMFDAINGAGARSVVPQTLVFDRGGNLKLHLRGFRPDFRDIVRETLEEALT